MPDLLVELFSEEIPARMQHRAADQLRQRLTDALVDAGLTYEGARAYHTPRRLTLDVRGLTARSADTVEERKGPRVDAAEKAVAGFLRGAGLASVEDAEVRSDPKKGDFYVAVIKREGRAAEDVIAEALTAIIYDFPWPKSMRWGPVPEPQSVVSADGKQLETQDGQRIVVPSPWLKWVRPLQSILCTFGPETEEPVVINVEAGGIKSGNVTSGHRFHAPEPFMVRRFDDYVAGLERRHVILDAERRKQIIATDAGNLAFANGIELVEDETLLDEVAGLVEWPVVLLGEFEPEFLAIPDEVIRLTIKANQKCFVCRDPSTGALTNRFVLVANIVASDGGAEIARGNAKVVRARLADALHFWNTDQANLPDRDLYAASAKEFDLDMAKPLDQRMAKLDHLGVTFHAKLGTQGERVARIAALAEELVDPIAQSMHTELVAQEGTGANLRALARRAAHLAKADLTTEIVGEFPELQGAMGADYARIQGEHGSVATAIEDHYKPLGPTDRVPTDPVAIAVALADKLDILTGFWAIDEKPTGSKDPYALRRAALGVIRIVLENGIGLRLASHSVNDDLLSFFHDRLKVYLRDKGARHDLIDAVLGEGDDDLLLVVRRVEALQKLIESDTGANLLAGTERALSILDAEEKKDGAGAFDKPVDRAHLVEPAEKELAAVIEAVRGHVDDHIARDDYEGAFASLAELRPAVDAFFEQVMVNADDAALRGNRLAMLAGLRATTRKLADFSRIAGQ